MNQLSLHCTFFQIVNFVQTLWINDLAIFLHITLVNDWLDTKSVCTSNLFFFFVYFLYKRWRSEIVFSFKSLIKQTPLLYDHLLIYKKGRGHTRYSLRPVARWPRLLHKKLVHFDWIRWIKPLPRSMFASAARFAGPSHRPDEFSHKLHCEQVGRLVCSFTYSCTLNRDSSIESDFLLLSFLCEQKDREKKVCELWWKMCRYSRKGPNRYSAVVSDLNLHKMARMRWTPRSNDIFLN